MMKQAYGIHTVHKTSRQKKYTNYTATISINYTTNQQNITTVYCMTAAQYYSSLLYDSSTILQQFTA